MNKPTDNKLWNRKEYDRLNAMKNKPTDNTRPLEAMASDDTYIVGYNDGTIEKGKVSELVNNCLQWKAQRDAALAALRRTLDALMNETHGRQDSLWIIGTKDQARRAIAAADSTSSLRQAQDVAPQAESEGQ